MRLIWLICIFLINPITHSSISGNEELSQSQIIELAKDEVWREESLNLEKIIIQQTSLIRIQNEDQLKINDALNEFFQTDMTNEELWEILAEIDVNSDEISDISEKLTTSFKITTTSKVPIAKVLYSDLIGLFFEISSYISKNNKVTRDLIYYLSEGDTDSYAYLYGQSSIFSSDYKEILAKKNYAQARLMPTSSIQKHLLLMEAGALEFNLIIQRMNGNHISGQLTKQLFSKLENSSKLKYKKFNNSKSYKNLLREIEKIETEFEFFLSDEDNRTSSEIIRKLLISAKIYADSITRTVESWEEVYLFYKKNIDNLDAIETNPYISAEFENMIDRQSFIGNEAANHAQEFVAAYIAYMEYLPTLLKE